jgi:hypothetical protein
LGSKRSGESTRLYAQRGLELLIERVIRLIERREAKLTAELGELLGRVADVPVILKIDTLLWRLSLDRLEEPAEHKSDAQADVERAQGTRAVE